MQAHGHVGMQVYLGRRYDRREAGEERPLQGDRVTHSHVGNRIGTGGGAGQDGAPIPRRYGRETGDTRVFPDACATASQAGCPRRAVSRGLYLQRTVRINLAHQG